MRRSTAQIVREYGPFSGADTVHGVTYDGRNVWFAAGDKLIAFDPASGKTVRSIDVAADAGTAFDGQHLFQLAEDRIQKIDPKTRFFAPSSRTASSPGSPGSTESSGTAPGKARRASSGESILERERSSSGSRCRPERSFRASSPMAAISSSAEEQRAGR
jgi:hypothetical protein